MWFILFLIFKKKTNVCFVYNQMLFLYLVNIVAIMTNNKIKNIFVEANFSQK